MLQEIALFFILIFFLLLTLTVAVHLLFLVPYVPSRRRAVEKMVQAAELSPGQTVFDLGCGDGRLLFAAEKKAKVKTVGFEIAPLVFLLALVKKIIAHSKAEIRFQSLFSAPFKKANVIFCYLLPNIMPRLADKIKKECKKGTRIISNTFHIPGLKPYRVSAKNPKRGLPTIYMYKI